MPKPPLRFHSLAGTLIVEEMLPGNKTYSVPEQLHLTTRAPSWRARFSLPGPMPGGSSCFCFLISDCFALAGQALAVW